MITILSRIVHYGFKNFIRSGLLSTATVAIVTLSLSVFIGLILVNAATGRMIDFLEDKIDISVYFQTNVPEDEILSIKSSLEDLAEVKSVEYISADEALAMFRDRKIAEGETAIVQSLDELDTNPLESYLNIKAHDPSRYDKIAENLSSDSLRNMISKVSYEENKVVIDRLVGIVSGVNRAGLLVTLILVFIAGLVVFNTIRLVIYSNRDEIGIMRAVGASNTLVRGPYIVEGMIIGSISAVLSMVLVIILMLVLPLFSSGGNYFDFSVPGFSLTSYFYSNFFMLLLWQLIFGIALTSISSFIAVRRYLRN